MMTFEDLKLAKQLNKAVVKLGFKNLTLVQEKSFPVIMSGKDMVGIAQTGTGKTFAYLLPILHELKYSDQLHPRVLILVPTRELVLQVVDNIKTLTESMSVRVLGVYGGTNINTQKQAVAEGVDILVATPGRLYDIAVTGVLQLNGIKKLVIDEVDIMLDLGFRRQLTDIFLLLKERRQNIMFSATMTEEIDAIIDDFFILPQRVNIAVSGTPLENIAQSSYPVKNFHTKANLLSYLLEDKEEFARVLVFVDSKKKADKLYELLEEQYGMEACVVHSNKAQNYRERSVRQFADGEKRLLISTDVMARGLDIEKISHVINFDTPTYPENYMHRIGRTGRAEEEGKTILFYTEKEEPAKNRIERLMLMDIPVIDFPEEVQKSKELLPEERPIVGDTKNPHRNVKKKERGPAFHEKKEKNKRRNSGGKAGLTAKKYKKPQKRGDKIQNRKSKRR